MRIHDTSKTAQKHKLQSEVPQLPSKSALLLIREVDTVCTLLFLVCIT